MNKIPHIQNNHTCLDSVLAKFDKYSRQNVFKGETKTEFESWSINTQQLLNQLLGLDKFEKTHLKPVIIKTSIIEGNIQKQHIKIQTEDGVYMTMFILIPTSANKYTIPFICPHGHNGAGKYSVAGNSEYPAIKEKIDHYNYDYGLYLAKKGYVAICPDARGFGERREDENSLTSKENFLKGDCAKLANMGQALGIPVLGMLTWDLMRLIDYIIQRNEWNTEKLSCIGFSGGGMQALWLAALDERIKFAVISGYMYGYKDALLKLNSNCACNYVPNLWQHVDMGDIASLIAPRPMIIQSCKDDKLNGPRGIINVLEQVEIIKKAYNIFSVEENVIHEICEGTHKFHTKNLENNFNILLNDRLSSQVRHFV